MWMPAGCWTSRHWHRIGGWPRGQLIPGNEKWEFIDQNAVDSVLFYHGLCAAVTVNPLRPGLLKICWTNATASCTFKNSVFTFLLIWCFHKKAEFHQNFKVIQMTAASCFFYPSNFKLSYVIKWNVFFVETCCVYVVFILFWPRFN